MTVNAVNNGLNGETGTGQYVGSNSHSLIGTLNWGAESSLEVPNSASPSLTVSGNIAVDTSITGYTPLPQIHGGVNTLDCISIPSTDLSTTDGNIVVYNSASQKFTLEPESSGSSGKVVGSAFDEDLLGDATQSTSFVDTNVSVNYTPISASNTLFIEASFLVFNQKPGGGPTISQRFGNYRLRRTVPSIVDLCTQVIGWNMGGDSASNDGSYNTAVLAHTESAGSTALHTYTVQFSVPATTISTTIRGSIYPYTISVYEIEI